MPRAQAATAHPDFATQTYGDPWDYSNQADFDVQQRWWSRKLTNMNVANGMLSFDTQTFGELPLVRGFGAIAVPWGRDGSLHPIDSAKYTRLSFRMNADISAPTQGQITWYTCGTTDPSCLGGMPVTINPGWNTYDVFLHKYYKTMPMAWSGPITSLTLIPIGANIAAAHIDLDWVKLYDPTTTVDATPVSQLAPTPLPDSDYASIVRHDSWDMSQPTDVSPRNAAVSFDGQLLHGTNAAPDVNDPELTLPVPTPFSSTRFHTFSIRIWFDGGFSLADTDGGGMNARVNWWVNGQSAAQISQDILVYPGWQTITFDLNQPNILDETQVDGRVGWANQTINAVRFDPDEDRGARNWIVDWIRIGSDRPWGALDAVQRSTTTASVAGWSIDPNTAASTQMRVFVDRTVYAIPVANGRRDDVGALYPAYGPNHGFAGTVPIIPGPHRVCVWAINIGPGGHGLIGCQNI
ncbi:MAG TPA: hypothetical protein VHC63_08825 [Acidimicrobiales bacterium]|nr:hypothetical protein [Acidimicrobiales bacterium]